MNYCFSDHRPEFREARLLGRNFNMPGESFRGVQGPYPGVPDIRLQRGGYPNQFHNRSGNFNVHNHQGWHFNQQGQHRNSFYWWNHQLPSYFVWEYRTGPEKILQHTSAKHLEGYRQDVLNNMSRMQQHRAEAVDRANRGLDASLRIPNPYTSNMELARFGARMGVIQDSSDYDRQFGYPVMTGAREDNPFEHAWDRYRGMIDRHWSSPRHEGLQQLHDRWAAEPSTPYGQNQIAAINNYLGRWGTMADQQRGQVYRASMDAARPSFDVRGIQQNYLDSIMRQTPRQWQ